MRNACKLCLLPLLSILFFAGYVEARDIYVRLADGPSSVSLSSDGTITLLDAGKKNFGLGKTAVLTRSGGFALVGKNKFSLPLQISSSGLLGFKGRKYRGKFLLTKEFVLINILDVEDYIRGVLPAEAIPGWPIEYLKVQAIISRTYGLRQSLNRSVRGYDVADNTSDQVYKGAGVETTFTNQAIKETEGEVLAYGGNLAFTPYHSDSGGHTATNAHVWGKDIPYLRGVKELVVYQSPNTNWTAKISGSQVQAALAKVGGNIGRVKEIQVSEMDSGGRATNLTFIGSGGSSTIKSSQFRTVIGPNLLKSTMLTNGVPLPKTLQGTKTPNTPAKNDALLGAPVPTSNLSMSETEELRLILMTSEGVFTSTELMDMLLKPEKRKEYLYIGIERSGSEKKKEPPKTPLPKSLPSASMPTLRSGGSISEENGYFVFQGRGWGHGVGLSQWGAQALAREGWTARRILEHYYPGTAVKRFQ